MVHTMRLSIPI